MSESIQYFYKLGYKIFHFSLKSSCKHPITYRLRLNMFCLLGGFVACSEPLGVRHPVRNHCAVSGRFQHEHDETINDAHMTNDTLHCSQLVSYGYFNVDHQPIVFLHLFLRYI